MIRYVGLDVHKHEVEVCILNLSADTAVPCECGSPMCRGWIMAKEVLDRVESHRRGHSGAN